MSTQRTRPRGETAGRPGERPAQRPTLGRIGVVAARYGPDVVGGAETVLREMAHGLRQRGCDVEVLTTTATDLYSFASTLQEGLTVDGGVPVRRFRAAPPQRGADPIGHRILAGLDVSVADQLYWMNTGPRCPGMFEYLVDHAHEYHTLICAPYQSWTSFICAEVAPLQTVTIPCLHDEPFARLDIFKSELEATRSVWFLSEPERALASRLFDLPADARVIGSGITPPASYDPDGFRARHGLSGPFIFYAGRRESMKGWSELLDDLSFATDTLGCSLPLVTCGVGDIGRVPGNVSVTDLGFLDDQERSNGFAAATAYVQPSSMESFSRTVLESWLAGTLVIANARSEVVRWHCERSGAGLMYSDRYELTEALRLLSTDEPLCREIASRGREYVLREFSWSDVLDRAMTSLAEHA